VWTERARGHRRAALGDVGLSHRGARHYESLAYVAAAAAIAGAAISAYGAYSAGQARQEAGRYDAAVAERQAQEARDAARVDAENQARVTQREQATRRARAADSGVEPSYGSPLLGLMEDARLAELDQQRILYGGELRGSGFEANARLQRYQGAQAGRAGTLGAGINLLSGVSSAARGYATPRTKD
jgi:hypothetical protein